MVIYRVYTIRILGSPEFSNFYISVNCPAKTWRFTGEKYL